MEKDSLKFFDVEIPIIEATGTIDRHITDLRNCMRSEDFYLENDEIIKAMDIYLRIVGLDRNVDKEKGLAALYSLCGVISLNADTIGDDENKLNMCKKAFINVNTLADEDKRLSDAKLNYILDNIKIIFKEFPVFINEVLLAIKNYVDSNERLANYHVLYKTKEDTMFMISGNYIADIEDFAYDIVSNVICSRSPENVAIIVNTFSTESQEKLKEGIQTIKNGQN
jgi:hypothetical protein